MLAKAPAKPAAAKAPSAANSMYQHDLSWLTAWVVIIAVFLLLTQIKAGRVVVYYGLVLMLFFLVVTQAQWFATALAPFSTLGKTNDDQAGGAGTLGAVNDSQ